MDVQKTMINMKEHIEWLNNPYTFGLPEITLSHLKEGYIYIAGTDRKMRPTVIFDVGKIDLKISNDTTIIPAYSRIFKIVEEYLFFGSKIETWNVIIETSDLGAFNIPVSILGKIITTMQQNFPSNLNKIYILNPSRSLTFSWAIIEAFISARSRKKITFLKKDQISQMMENYNPDQLEKRFGGQAPNVTQYYPPVSFQPSQEYVQKAKEAKQTSNIMRQSMEGSQFNGQGNDLQNSFIKQQSVGDSVSQHRYYEQEPNNYQFQQQKQNQQFQPQQRNVYQQPQEYGQVRSDYRLQTPPTQQMNQSALPQQQYYPNQPQGDVRQRNSAIGQNQDTVSRSSRSSNRKPIFNNQRSPTPPRQQNQQMFLTQQPVNQYSQSFQSNNNPSQPFSSQLSNRQTPLKFQKNTPDQQREVIVEPPQYRSQQEETESLRQSAQPSNQYKSYTDRLTLPLPPVPKYDQQFEPRTHNLNNNSFNNMSHNDSLIQDGHSYSRREKPVIYSIQDHNGNFNNREHTPVKYTIAQDDFNHNRNDRTNEEQPKRSMAQERTTNTIDLYSAYKSINPLSNGEAFNGAALKNVKYNACNIF